MPTSQCYMRKCIRKVLSVSPLGISKFQLRYILLAFVIRKGHRFIKFLCNL
jgi:hypothetical protein